MFYMHETAFRMVVDKVIVSIFAAMTARMMASDKAISRTDRLPQKFAPAELSPATPDVLHRDRPRLKIAMPYPVSGAAGDTHLAAWCREDMVSRDAVKADV